MLRRRIAAVRSKWLTVEVAGGLGRVIIILALMLSIGMVVDWAVDLEPGFRTFLLLVYGVVTLTMVAIHVFGPITSQPSMDETALMIERGIPEYRSRLIASIQLARGTQQEGTSSALVKALVDQTESFTSKRDLSRVISMEMMGALLGLAVVMLIAIGGVVAVTPNGMTFLKRTVFLNTKYPYETELSINENIITVARGDSAEIIVNATGVTPDDGQLTIQFDSSDPETMDYPRTEHDEAKRTAVYYAKFDDIRQSFDFSVSVNQGDHRPLKGRVRVVPRPLIKSITANIQYPDYTGEPDSSVKVESSQIGKVLAGSTVRLRVTASKPIREAKLWLHRGDDDNATDVQPASTVTMVEGEEAQEFEIEFKAEFASVAQQSFHIQLLDSDKIVSMDDLHYSYLVEADAQPEMVLRSPRNDDEVVAQSISAIAGRVNDNYGLTELGLRYRVLTSVIAEPMEGRLELLRPYASQLDNEIEVLVDAVAKAENTGAAAALRSAREMTTSAANNGTEPSRLLGQAAGHLLRAASFLKTANDQARAVRAEEIADRAKLEGRQVELPVNVVFDLQKEIPELAKLGPAPTGQPHVVEYWLEGRDNNAVRAEEPARSKTRRLVIVPAGVKLAELRKRMNQLVDKVDKTAEEQKELRALFIELVKLLDQQN